MIKYVQEKKIDYPLFEKILSDSSATNQFTNIGPAKIKLEKKLKEILNLPDTKTVVCTANGTLSLHALFFFFKARGLKRFVTPSYTFPSSIVGGFETEVVDISLENYCFEEEEKIIQENDCIIITNLFGTYPKNLKSILQQCKENNTKVILDNASSPMTNIEGENFCSLGDASFGSLHHTKYLGFGEGGFIVIDKEHKEEINRILGFGFTGKTVERISEPYSSNFKFSDVTAAAILQHIINYDLSAHIEKQNLFVEMISDVEGVSIFNYSEGVVYGNMPIVFKDPASTSFFRDNYIEAHKYYYPLRNHKNSLFLYERIINLPLYSTLNDFEIEKIVKIVKIGIG
tara:strand:+ start:2956 stop:3987 length:1032 start_codon:yes stop_codon:yes gene_type:complete